jgi:hypothetical protein
LLRRCAPRNDGVRGRRNDEKGCDLQNSAHSSIL